VDESELLKQLDAASTALDQTQIVLSNAEWNKYDEARNLEEAETRAFSEDKVIGSNEKQRKASLMTLTEQERLNADNAIYEHITATRQYRLAANRLRYLRDVLAVERRRAEI